jgi:hypothetical protein
MVKIDYKEKQQPEQIDEPIWLGVIMGLAWFGLSVAAIYLLLAVEALMNL